MNSNRLTGQPYKRYRFRRMFPYRDENPTEKPAIITVAIIIANTLVFILLRGTGAIGAVGMRARADPGRAAAHREAGEWRGARAWHRLPGRCRAEVLDGDLVDVYPWWLAAPHRQHAVPLGLREQHRRRDGPWKIHRLLSVMRHRGGGDANAPEPALDRPYGRSLGRNQRCAGGVPAALSQRAGPHADHFAHLHHVRRAASVGDAWLLGRSPTSRRTRGAPRDPEGGRGVLRPRRWVYRGTRADPPVRI